MIGVPFAVFLMMCGPVVGSFLGVLVDRWPHRRSLIEPSRCDQCGTRLGVVDLIPIVSGLRRRCRHCGGAIPGHLLRIELAASMAAALAVLIAAGPVEALVLALFLWCLIGLFYSDLLHFLLPDPLNAGLLVTGLGLAWLDPGRGLIEAALSAAGAVAAFGALRWIYARWHGREGLGLGDVKLVAGLGAGLGWALLPITTLLAAALALAVAALEGRLRRATRVPFGAYLCAAAVLVLILPVQ